MPRVAQVSSPMAFTPEIIRSSSGRSRFLSSRQAAPMQKRCAPRALARAASAITISAAVSLEALRPVSKWIDWLQ
jgi:hypothetical protein